MVACRAQASRGVPPSEHEAAGLGRDEGSGSRKLWVQPCRGPSRSLTLKRQLLDVSPVGPNTIATETHRIQPFKCAFRRTGPGVSVQTDHAVRGETDRVGGWRRHAYSVIRSRPRWASL